MKKTVIAILTILVAVPAFSQQRQQQQQDRKIRSGTKIGYNLADLNNSGLSSMRSSFYAGLWTEFDINWVLSIQPEVVYSRQGDRDKTHGVTNWLRNDYINVPVLAKIYLIDNLSIDVGPQVGFLVKSTLKSETDGITVSGDFKSFDDQTKRQKVDVGVAMGLSYKCHKNMSVTARYNLGFLDTFKDNPDKKITNGVFQVGVAFSVK